MVVNCSCGVVHTRGPALSASLSQAGTVFWLGARVLGGLSGIIVVLLCLAGSTMVAQSQTEALRSNPSNLRVAAGFCFACYAIAGLWLRAVLIPRSLVKILAGWFAFQMLVLFVWMGVYWITAHEPPWGTDPGDVLPALRTLAILIGTAAFGSVPAAASFAVAHVARRSVARSRRLKVRERHRNKQRPTP